MHITTPCDSKGSVVSTWKRVKAYLTDVNKSEYRAHLRVALYGEDVMLPGSSPQVDVRGRFLVEVPGVHDRPERQNFSRAMQSARY